VWENMESMLERKSGRPQRGGGQKVIRKGGRGGKGDVRVQNHIIERFQTKTFGAKRTKRKSERGRDAASE